MNGGTATRTAGRTVAGPLRRAALLLGLPALLLAAWWVVSAGSEDPYRPPLSAIVTALRREWLGHRLLDDVAPSLTRLAVGYVVALVLGVTLGVLVGSSRTLRALLEPVLEFLRAIPPPVLVPVLILLFGLGDTMNVLVIVSGCVWPVLLNTVEGVRGIDEVLADTCRGYRIRGWYRLRHLVLRAASPQIVTGARQALAIGIILMVISEMFAASSGLGFTVVQFQRSFAIPEMWSGVIVLGLTGVLLSGLFALAERWLLGWYHGQRASMRDDR